MKKIVFVERLTRSCNLINLIFFQNEPKNKITNVPQPFPEEALEIKDVSSNLPKPFPLDSELFEDNSFAARTSRVS